MPSLSTPANTLCTRAVTPCHRPTGWMLARWALLTPIVGRSSFWAGADGTIYAADLASPVLAVGGNSLSLPQKLQGHTGAVISLAMSVDGSMLISGSRDGSAKARTLAASAAAAIAGASRTIAAVARCGGARQVACKSGVACCETGMGLRRRAAPENVCAARGTRHGEFRTQPRSVVWAFCAALHQSAVSSVFAAAL
jgi:hypothetical protein